MVISVMWCFIDWSEVIITMFREMVNHRVIIVEFSMVSSVMSLFMKVLVLLLGMCNFMSSFLSNSMGNFVCYFVSDFMCSLMSSFLMSCFVGFLMCIFVSISS